MKRKRVTQAFREKVKRDVEAIKTKAVAIITLSGDDVRVNWNRNAVLAVVAMIGPGREGKKTGFGKTSEICSAGMDAKRLKKN